MTSRGTGGPGVDPRAVRAGVFVALMVVGITLAFSSYPWWVRLIGALVIGLALFVMMQGAITDRHGDDERP